MRYNITLAIVTNKRCKFTAKVELQRIKSSSKYISLGNMYFFSELVLHLNEIFEKWLYYLMMYDTFFFIFLLFCLE